MLANTHSSLVLCSGEYTGDSRLSKQGGHDS